VLSFVKIKRSADSALKPHQWVYNQVLGMIKRTFTSRSKEIKIPLYKSLVRPHLDYCVQAWRSHLIKGIQVLEKVQRRATRFIEECRGMSYEYRLRTVGLTTLETRRLRADKVEVHKILRGFEGTEEVKCFQEGWKLQEGMILNCSSELI